MPGSWLEIDLAALRHNYAEVRKRLKPATRAAAVVKSEAYGHGMIPCARELSALGCEFFAVSKVEEARRLREAGFAQPVLVLIGIDAAEAEEAVALDLRPALFRLDHAKALSAAAGRLGKPARVHIKVDSGLGRLGVPLSQLAGFLHEIAALPGLEVEGMFSHFAVADEAEKSYSERQAACFREMMGMCEACGISVRYAHMANSAGVLDLPGVHFDLVRPGIMLYGSLPSAELLAPAELRPVMTLKSRIALLKSVSAGCSIGYGRTYVTTAETRIATIPVGYADGYLRALSNRAEVLVGGRRCPLAGRVSMNMITVDVSGVPGVAEDDEVVLLGAQGAERVSAEELAGLAGTITHEIFCALGANPHKRYLNATA